LTYESTVTSHELKHRSNVDPEQRWAVQVQGIGFMVEAADDPERLNLYRADVPKCGQDKHSSSIYEGEPTPAVVLPVLDKDVNGEDGYDEITP
jgi:hypothetical protein